MERFIFSLNATIPIFLVIFFGGILRYRGMFTESFLKVLDKYIFHVALPALLFFDVSTTDLREIFEWKFVIFCMVVTTIMFMGVWGITQLFCKDKKIVGALAQASARGSAAILGIAFVNNIYGNSGMAPLMIVSAVPLYNIYSVIILTFGEGEMLDQMKTEKKELVRKAFFNVWKNPIILGIFAGIPFSVLGISFPTIVSTTISSISQTATPMALLSVGASFQGRSAIARIRPTILASVTKLIILPAIFFPFAIWMGFTGSKLVAILVMLASPTTVTSYVMAKNMGNDAELTSSIVVLTTILSAFTLTIWIFILKSMNLI